MRMTRRAKQLRWLNRIKLISFLGVLAAVLFLILNVNNLLVSSLLAFVISYLLGPYVNYLERLGISRLIAVTITFVAVSTLLGIAVSAILPPIASQLGLLKSEFPKYVQGLTQLMADTEERFQILAGSYFSIDLSEHVESALSPWTKALFFDFPSFITKSVTTLLLAPFIAFFMIKDGKVISRNLLNLVPNSIFETTLSLYHQINDQMGHFVRARLLEAMIVGCLTWVGLFIIGFPYATILALFAALTNLIPYVGPIIGAIPAISISIINGDSSFELFLVCSVYFTAQLIDAAFIIPLVVAKIVDLHPITVIVAIIAGAQVLGVVGMLISIPVASIIKVTVSTVYRHLTDYRSI
ncbi:MAG: AI-2E family transporter [Bdellovibrionales bacterium]|nr:AI-2E family transporter [Bdellovibrionales bacterium]